MTKSLINHILYENSVMEAASASTGMLNMCSDKCRNSIKNGPNYTAQVQCCTSACKIKAYTKIIASLRASLNSNLPKENINKKIAYFTMQLQKEQMKYKQYRIQLKKRQTAIPSSMSMKPTKIH